METPSTSRNGTKMLPVIIHTNCFGCTHDRPSQSEHECMMRDKEESVGIILMKS